MYVFSYMTELLFMDNDLNAVCFDGFNNLYNQPKNKRNFNRSTNPLNTNVNNKQKLL